MFLTKAEIAELTGRKRKDAQVMALRGMGIEHRVRPDGTVAVLKAYVEGEMGIKVKVTKEKRIEPNWDAAGA